MRRLVEQLYSPPMTGAERKIRSLLATAGITVNGTEPYDIQVHDPRAFSRVAVSGRLGAGESYMAGWWDCSRLDEAVSRLGRGRSPLAGVGRHVLAIGALSGMLRNLQTRRASQRNASSTYDVSNDLYEAMLGRTMAYTCGYWSQARTLDEAQDAKHDLICRKLDLKPGMRLLDIGCGWGGLSPTRANTMVSSPQVSPLPEPKLSTSRAGGPTSRSWSVITEGLPAACSTASRAWA